MSLQQYNEFRRQLADALIGDLMGPSAEEEVIDDAPITRYIAGILYPRNSGTVRAEQDIDISDDDEDGTTADPPVALANVRYPSSMGITFSVDTAAAATIRIEVFGARYTPLDEINNDANPPVSSSVRRIAARVHWQRRPLAVEPIKLDITRPHSGYRIAVADSVELFCRIRPADNFGRSSVTLVLLNTRIATGGDRDEDALYQPRIRVTAPDAATAVFVERTTTGRTDTDNELRSYRLLYRHALEFAIGHGCSVRWEKVEPEGDRATVIETTFTPEYAVPMADSNPAISGRGLEMYFLAHGQQSEVLVALEELCKGYERWIADRYHELAHFDAEYQSVGHEHLDRCREALTRIRRGIRLLAETPLILRAFRLANKAMLQQRARSLWLRTNNQTLEPVESNEHKWRPFQLAFILQCLEGTANPDSPDRELADLLWFPTGGGKTEAYLGLIAFTVFLRRLRHVDGGGVTAIMRYTLRLLTIQQFERAALLICACEAIRRATPDLGNEPISIGLWVGQNATPNTLNDARAAINKLRQGNEVNEGNPCQVHTCPWCGTPLDSRNYWIADGRAKMIISCRQQNCLFKEELPIYLIDDDVYRYRPTLLIATVDKFASLPWREQAAELFNLKTSNHSAQPPPELIVQDELHLISGPLGTLTGLYETIIDCVCATYGTKPKVIASTATIRRAGGQTRGLFNREIRQFPPPGLDARDSYFAVESSPDRRGNRLYMGLMAPGTSHTTLLVRTYSALLQNVQDIPAHEVIKNPYWTLVGYFNSLRVLGGARMQVQDDVHDRMYLLASQVGVERRSIDNNIELTSREPSSKIPGYLKWMAENYRSGNDSLDVILATNMISVGVDIDRLGLMAVMGQPQSTSEYIQSTSRVGRTYPGLVVAIYNAARSRDRSHYESFTAYHSALYRHVESTSVTPFSSRARDRGLHAVVVALARLLVPEFRHNDAAGRIVNDRALLDPVIDLIVSRIKAVASDEEEPAEQQILSVLNEWHRRAEEEPDLKYSNPRDVSRSLLIEAAADPEERGAALPTLWSLRDVDKESQLYLVS